MTAILNNLPCFVKVIIAEICRNALELQRELTPGTVEMAAELQNSLLNSLPAGNSLIKAAAPADR